MSVLTPSGYREIEELQVGDEVSAFDMETGEPLVNVIEGKQWVDAAEWVRWHTNADLPPFRFYRINGTWTLNSEQSIWRNGTEVCHAKHLIGGDTLYDDADHPVIITSIEEAEADGWWRFDISGDHSYIVDGLTLHNASRFWFGGTGTWDLSTQTHWSGTSGGPTTASAPGSADTVTFDGSSGGGTVTPSYGGTGTFQSITGGAFTGTVDWSTNNNSVSLGLASGTALNLGGTATRTFKLGGGTWTFSGTGALISLFNNSGMTFNGSSAALSFTAVSSAVRSLALTGAPYTFASLTVAANSSGGQFTVNNNTVTFTTVSIGAPNYILWPAAVTTITNALSITGTSSGPVGFASGTGGTQATISSANNGALAWAGLHDMKFQGGGTFTAANSFDLGNNSGITITAPSAGGGVSRARAQGAF